MNQVQYREIFDAIKSDNLVLFAQTIKGNERISFGRFPVLSLCYLYRAKRIIDEYEKQLIWSEDYIIVEEYLEIYNTFKVKAGRLLRLYIKDDSVVSPFEMLAILHQDSRLKRIYNNKKGKRVNKKIINNLKTIYFINSQKFEISDLSIKIARRRMTGRERRVLTCSLIVSVVTIMLVSLLLGMYGFVVGFGSANSPIKVSTEAQLIKALDGKSHYVLTRDIELEECGFDIDFNGTINGQGHHIFIKNSLNNYIIKTNSGTIKNLGVKYGNLDAQITNSLSLFVCENRGLIDNVTISCGDIKLLCSKSQEIELYVSGIANVNDGNILNCGLQIGSASIIAEEDGEGFFSGITGINNGNIDNCYLLSDKNLASRELDIAGICVSNSYGATINNCYNKMALQQNSEEMDWSPTIGGVAIENYGLISDSQNLSALKIISECEQEDVKGNIILGGVCANNFGEINACLNKGNLEAKAKKLIVYCGGISAYSTYYVREQNMILPAIINCGTRGEINISTEDDKAIIFGGGISGYMYGKVVDCFSITTFINGYTEEKSFLGKFLGAAYLQYQIFGGSTIYLDVSNNYVLSSNMVDYHIGALINNGSIVSGGVDLANGVSGCETTNDMENLDVYFDKN